MICPRCGIVNSDGDAACSRCGGSLAAPPRRDEPLPAVKPLTRRAELAMLSTQAAQQPPQVTAVGSGAASSHNEDDLYLLSSERSGQPSPPGSQPPGPAPSPAQAGQRNDRFLPRLSPAP